MNKHSEKLVASNMEKAFRLPSLVNKDFIRNLIWHHHQQQQQEIINQQQQQNINQVTSECVLKYIQEKTCAEVSF